MSCQINVWGKNVFFYNSVHEGGRGLELGMKGKKGGGEAWFCKIKDKKGK
jgi:hypothetical protein